MRATAGDRRLRDSGALHDPGVRPASARPPARRTALHAHLTQQREHRLDTTAPSGGLSPDALRTWSRKQRALRDEHDARETGAPRVRRAQQEMLVSPSTTPLAYSPVELRLFGSTALVEIIHRAIKVLVATLTSTADSFVALEKRGAEPRVLHVADGLARPRRSVVIAVEQR